MQNENFQYKLNSFKKWLSMHRERKNEKRNVVRRVKLKLTLVFLSLSHSLIEDQTKNFLKKIRRVREREKKKVSEKRNEQNKIIRISLLNLKKKTTTTSTYRRQVRERRKKNVY